jgi:hypothetical protein
MYDFINLAANRCWWWNLLREAPRVESPRQAGGTSINNAFRLFSQEVDQQQGLTRLT